MLDSYDVVVVGGGAAGLSGAVALARSRRSVLVVDAGEQRNAPAAAMHNYLGREGLNPLELVRLGRQELAGYGGDVVSARVVEVAAGFRVTLDTGAVVRARRLLVATGLRDELPAVEGLAERWGQDVIHCPYCHGYEHRDRAIGVLGSGPALMHQALLFRQLSDDLIVFRHTAELSGEDRARLAGLGVQVVDDEVAAVESTGAGVSGVRLTTGEVVPREVVVVAPRFLARLDGLDGLGLEVAENAVVVDPVGKTSVPGVWAAGNVTSPAAQVIVSAGQGLTAGAQINYDLILEDAR